MSIDLTGFKFYRNLDNHRKVKAVFVPENRAEEIGKQSGLWEMFGHAMCYGIMALASPNQWAVVELNQRTGKPRKIDFLQESVFKEHFKLMKKQEETK